MTANRILIDTSVWIDYFRDKNQALSVLVDQLLDDDLVVSLEVIEAELYRGARSDKEIHFLENYFSHIPSLEQPSNIWRKVGQFTYQIARKGHSIGLIDACIAFMAIENKVQLYSLDKDFKQISARSSLKLFG